MWNRLNRKNDEEGASGEDVAQDTDLLDLILKQNIGCIQETIAVHPVVASSGKVDGGTEFESRIDAFTCCGFENY